MYGRKTNPQYNLDKENDQNVFAMQQNANTNMQSGYFQPRQNMQPAGGFNPLCLQRPDAFNQVYGPGFDTSKPSNSPFQNMNGLGFDSIHTGMGGLGGGLHPGLSNDLNNGMTNSMVNTMANGLHGGVNSLSHGLNGGPNNGAQYQPGNNQGQSNGFDVQ